jgi:tetratricopeptide (TPR) repeat protein
MENDALFTAFSEKALLLNPSNNSLRFSLAYKYSNMDRDKLALYHYNILAANSPDSSNCNNLGVAYANLEMPSKAVEYYIKANELGATISRANLAQKLLNEGFIDYANEQLKEAMKSENYEKDNIGKALSRIDRIREEEAKKEKEALGSIEEERQFKLDYAEAYSMDFIVGDTLNGDWNSKHGKIEINLKSDNNIYGKKEETIEENNWILGMSLAAGSGSIPPEKRRIKFIKTFQGKILKNRTFEYNLKIERSPAYNTLLAGDLSISEFSGYGIINKRKNLLKVVEFDKDKKQSFLEMAKI